MSNSIREASSPGTFFMGDLCLGWRKEEGLKGLNYLRRLFSWFPGEEPRPAERKLKKTATTSTLPNKEKLLQIKAKKAFWREGGCR